MNENMQALVRSFYIEVNPGKRMAKTLAQLQKQIDKLQREADLLKAREIDEVVARVKQAIAHYGLTPDDLFNTKAAIAPKAKKSPAAGKKTSAVKPPSPMKYRDANGNAWTGRGKRPNWYLTALAQGKTPEDLLIKV